MLQQLNCDLGVAGKTANLNVRYRRPTPLLTKLRIVATREIVDRKIHSNAAAVSTRTSFSARQR